MRRLRPSSRPLGPFAPRTAGDGCSTAKIFSGWTPRNPAARKVWIVCREVQLDPSDSARLLPVGEGGTPDAVMLCGDDGRGSDLMTTESFSDYQLHLEFNVPKGSNSGVYNRGLFEIQVFDSFGKEPIGFHDCGALLRAGFSPGEPGEAAGPLAVVRHHAQGKEALSELERQAGLSGSRYPLWRDRSRGVRASQPRKCAQPGPLRVNLRETNGRYVGYFGDVGTSRSSGFSAVTVLSRMTTRGPSSGRWPEASGKGMKAAIS